MEENERDTSAGTDAHRNSLSDELWPGSKGPGDSSLSPSQKELLQAPCWSQAGKDGRSLSLILKFQSQNQPDTDKLHNLGPAYSEVNWAYLSEKTASWVTCLGDHARNTKAAAGA